MKKYKIHIILVVVILVIAGVLISLYFSKDNNAENKIEASKPVETPIAIETPETTEEPHEHDYKEDIILEATCEADGEKRFTCDCGDTYSEKINATGHKFENYVYNNDATYFADGTQTAQCKHCEATDTQVALNSKLEELQTEDPMDIAARRFAERFGISEEEARAMLENGGNPVGNGGGSTSNSNGNNTSSSDNGGGTDLNLTPGMGGNGGDLVTDGTLNDTSSGSGERSPDLEANDAAAGDGGELVTDGVIGDGTSHNNSSNNGSFDFGAAGDANAGQSDGGEIVTDGTLNP